MTMTTTEKQYRKVFLFASAGNGVRMTIDPQGRTADGRKARILRHKEFQYDLDTENASMAVMLMARDFFNQLKETPAFQGATIALYTLNSIGWILRAGYARVKNGMDPMQAAEEIVEMHDKRITKAGEPVTRYSDEFCTYISDMVTSLVGLDAMDIYVSIFDYQDTADRAKIAGKDGASLNVARVTHHSPQTKADIAKAWDYLPAIESIEIDEAADAVGF